MLNRLTGIRAIAALFVVFYHFGDSFAALFPALVVFRPIYKSGDMGVDLFFLLSGFILSLNYLDDFQQISVQSYWKFLRARLARIYPVHLFTLLLLTGFVVFARHASMLLNSGHYTRFTWMTNVLLLQIWPGFNRGLSWNFPSWSISSEWFAYLLFPIFAFCIGTTKRPVKWFSLALLAYMVPCIFGIEHHPTHWALLRVSSEFVAGCFLFQIYRGGWKCPIPAWSSGLLGLSICVMCTKFDVTRSYGLPFFALLIWGLAVETRGWLSGSVAVYWGQVSYSLYMTHGLCQIVLNRVLPTTDFVAASFLTRAGIVAFYLCLIAVTAVFTYHFVETPARRWLNRSEKRGAIATELQPTPILEEEPSVQA